MDGEGFGGEPRRGALGWLGSFVAIGRDGSRRRTRALPAGIELDRYEQAALV